MPSSFSLALALAAVIAAGAATAAAAAVVSPYAWRGDIAEYELYCHYVAGLVGEGL